MKLLLLFKIVFDDLVCDISILLPHVTLLFCAASAESFAIGFGLGNFFILAIEIALGRSVFSLPEPQITQVLVPCCYGTNVITMRPVLPLLSRWARALM